MLGPAILPVLKMLGKLFQLYHVSVEAAGTRECFELLGKGPVPEAIPWIPHLFHLTAIIS